MNWFKENPAALVLLVLAVIGTGATSYLAVDATTRRDEAQAALDSQTQKLKQFQNQKPFPTEQNLKLVKESTGQYRDELGKYRTMLAAMEAPLTPINPQEFQDELRKSVDETRKKAIEKGVTLPDNFFYGLDQYQATPPSQQEVPELNREFQTLRRIVDELIDLKIAAIGSLKRLEPAKKASTPAPPAPAKPGATPEPPKAPSISNKTFALTFTAPQEKLLAAFNMIQGADEFLIIRSLTMDNTNPAAPLRTPLADASSPQAQPTLGSNDKPQDTIQAILGREAVTASFTIEILDFPDWESPPAPK